MAKIQMDKEQVADLIVRTFALRGPTAAKLLIVEVLADAEQQIEALKNKETTTEKPLDNQP